MKNLNRIELKELSIFLSKIFKKNLNFQFKNKFSTEFLNWLYNKNPNGKAIVNNIYKDKKIIAHFALVPIKVKFNNKIYKSALSVCTAVDKYHRGLFFFHQLANKSFVRAKSKGIRFIIGVGNKTSSDLFIKCFNFKLISPLDVKVGLSNFQEKDYLKHRFEILRDKATLDWRLKNPMFKYQIYEEKQKYYVFNNNYKIFKINMGNFSNKNLNLQNNKLLRMTDNLNPLNIWIGLNNNLKNTKMSFSLPKFLKLSSLNLIIKDLKLKETSLKKKDIKFNLIDFEIF